MKKRIRQADECARRARRWKAGFTLLELLFTALIVMVAAGIAVPNMLNFMHAARLRGSGSDVSSLLQAARIRAVQDDRFYSTYLIAGPPEEAYVDLKGNGGTGADSGDPLVAISSEVTPVAAASAPDTSNLKGQFLPSGSTLPVKDGSTAGTPVIFSPRGLPCTTQSATGGTVCDSAGGATAFWVFFQDSSTTAWEAVTIRPSGRIEKWQHGRSAWSKL
jgi:Tfp pilus assembly protein FimT